jgi:PelA/Pel-15E family pectate lyase
MNLFDKICRSIPGIALAGIVAPALAYTPPAAVLSALDKLRSYSELTSAAGTMDLDTYTANLTTWQMTNGGFSKAHAALYLTAWDGAAELSSWTGTQGEPLGMYDNNATVQEMRLLAVRYKATTNATNKKLFKASFNKAVGFLLASQLPNGGWPQVYPKRGNYSDMATYNDNAMVRVMVMVKDLVDKKAPFDSDITTADSLAKLSTALDKSVTFALKAQIVNAGKSTVWCAQHDPSSYAPAPARAYELASKSGSESIGIVYFLMAWSTQSTEVQKAVKGAIAWYKSTKVLDMQFSSGVFSTVTGKNMWYRFYNVEDDRQFFCDRDGIKTYDFSTVSLERQTGYQWAGDYGSTLIGMESAYLNALGTTEITTHPRTPMANRSLANPILTDVLHGTTGTRGFDARGVLHP